MTSMIEKPLNIYDILALPLDMRCNHLHILIERSSLRDLQDFFPIIVSSIFGTGTGGAKEGVGWGLRTITKETAPLEFQILDKFLEPVGPIFQLCYKLISHGSKFEFSLDLLPIKVAETLRSGQYSVFYADLINVDAFRRQVTSLYLNAFDYYILQFVVYALMPLHKIYPAALNVHNERTKTVYFNLCGAYLSMFLPGDPEGVVLPKNVCSTVKTPQPIPVQPLQPKQKLRYLKIPNLNMYADNSTAVGSSPGAIVLNTESPRAYAWRTESVLHFFLDIWFRFDVEENIVLPSTEFIRVVRLLVKQTHAFGNSATQDQTPMAALRKIAQPIMRVRFYPFIRGMIGRWPLDGSFAVVMELWISYIQPWRYTFAMQGTSPGTSVNSRFDGFITDNLNIYTQIFALILPRFERLDYHSSVNVIILHRFVKVLTQGDVLRTIYQIEQNMTGNSFGFDSTQRYTSYLRSNNSASGSEWDVYYSNDAYVPMFGNEMKSEVKRVLKSIHLSLISIAQQINELKVQIEDKEKTIGFLHSFLSVFSMDDLKPEKQKLQFLKRTPEILENAIHSLALVFDVECPSISSEEFQSSLSHSKSNFSFYDNSSYMDITKLTPDQMMHSSSCLKPTIDPALLPIGSYEVAFLVRFLHQFSCKINDMFGEQMQGAWNRSDIWGKIVRQILQPPMTASWFDKPNGINEMLKQDLPPRLCLRRLASYGTILSITISIIISGFFCGSPIYGCLTLILSFILYIYIRALLA